ncbi:MAG: hypothetical protein HY851_07600, partial [candidate division Zixibacteria bacterium]|nr:hypothetical protein [candidate division Zixibacteria bacterium]
MKFEYSTNGTDFTPITGGVAGVVANSSPYTWVVDDVILAGLDHASEATSKRQVWLKVSDADAGHPAASVVIPASFEVRYYKIRWYVKSFSGTPLKDLDVYEAEKPATAGGVKSIWEVVNNSLGTASGKFDRFYPHWTTDDIETIFTYQEIYSGTRFWKADKDVTAVDCDKEVSVTIDTQPDVIKTVEARTAYNFQTGELSISAWMEKKGLPLDASLFSGLEGVQIRIYDSTVSDTVPISPASPILGNGVVYDANGMYWVTWNTRTSGVELLKGRQYLIKTTITLSGVPYDGSDVFTLESPLIYSVQIDPVFSSIDKILMNVSLSQSGVLVSDLVAGELTSLNVLDDSGTSLTSLASADVTNALDSGNGIFHINWNPAANLTSGIVYTVVGKITYKGSTYSGTKALTIGGDLSSLSTDIAAVGTKVDTVQTTANTINTNLGSTATVADSNTLFGRAAAVAAQATAIQADTGAIKTETDKISTQVIPKIDAVQTTATAVQTSISGAGGLTEKIGVIEAKVTTDLPNQITAAQTNITDKIAAERKLEILNRSTTIKFTTPVNPVMTIRCRYNPGVTPTLTVYAPDNSSSSLAPTQISTTGIYQDNYTFTMAGDYTFVCQDTAAGSVDTVVIKVQANDFDSVFAKVDGVETKVNALTTTVGIINTSTSGISTDVGALLARLGDFTTGAPGTLFGEVAGVRAKTDTILWADVAATKTDVATLIGEVGTGNIAAIKTRTDTINWADVTGIVTTAGNIQAKTDTIDWTQVSAVKTATDTINWGDVTGVATKLGTALDLPSDATVFGKIAANQATADAIKANTAVIDWSKITTILDELGTGNIAAIRTATGTINWSDVTGLVTASGFIQAKTDTINWANITAVQTKTETINWADVTGIDANAQAIKEAIGQSTDTYLKETVFGKLAASDSGTNITLLEKVDTLQESVKTNTDDLAARIGAPTDAAATDTLFGRIKAGGGAKDTDKILKDIVGYVDDVEKYLGTADDTAASETVFGKI